jgi:hypothetical protein
VAVQPSEPDQADANYRRLIAHAPECALDLLALFRRQLPTTRTYLPKDLHWSAEAVALTAAATAERLTGRAFTLARAGTEPGYPPWLLRAFQLPAWALRPLLWDEPLYTLNGPAAPASRDRLIVAGTSFTEHLDGSPSGLSRLLGHALGRSARQVTIRAGGSVGSLYQLSHEGFHFQPGDILIWEFPARDENWPGVKVPDFRRPVI